MDISKKLIELDRIIDESELINMIRSLVDEESAEEMVLDLKIELIKLIEKK